MRDLFTLTHLTLHEALRRRILTAALIGGVAYLAIFATGLHFMVRQIGSHHAMTLIERRAALNVLTLAGLYAVNFLMVMSAVLLPLDTLSGEIQSGVIQTVAAKPVRRRDIVLGKWLGYWIVMAAYFTLLAGGVLAVARIEGHFTPPATWIGLPLMLLEGTVMLTVSIAGGTRLSTVTNGMLAFGLFGVAFIGNWVEQIGTVFDNGAARDVGTITSLLLPSEALWQLAAWHMQPAILSQLGASPFSPLSVPSPAMVWWALGYTIVVLAIGVRSFSRRAL